MKPKPLRENGVVRHQFALNLFDRRFEANVILRLSFVIELKPLIVFVRNLMKDGFFGRVSHSELLGGMASRGCHDAP